MTRISLSLSFLAVLSTGTDASRLERRAPAPPAICGTLNSCYARFSQASTASAYCSSFLPSPSTKTVTTVTTLPASTKVVTKIVTLKGTKTISTTQTIINQIASFVTSYQSCTTAATLAASSSATVTYASPSVGAIKRQASSSAAVATPVAIPGCLQYLLGTAPAATSTGCSCIVTPTTPTSTVTKTATPKVSTYTWTGTVSLESTIQYTTLVTVTPTLTVTMDALPCSLTATSLTASTPPSSTTTSSSTSSSSSSSAVSNAVPTPSSLCPAGGTFTSSDGSTFRIECNTDRPDSNIDWTVTDTLEECAALCATRGSDCAAISFVPYVSGVNCWIKNSAPRITYPSYTVHTLVRLTTTEAASSAGPRYIDCPDNEGLTYAPADGERFQVSCANTTSGTVLRNFQASSLLVCANGCDVFGLGKGCTSAAYSYSSRMCSYFGMDGVSVPASDDVGTVVRQS